MPRKFASMLRPLGWKESRISADLVIHLTHAHEKHGTGETKTIERYIDGHRIDYLKGKIACDFEWNSKDQTFDRDLYAFRTYYECGIISAAVIVTRSSELDTVCRHLGVNAKYGASTTWIGKLLPRLDSRRHGGCPILVFGITSLAVSTDWKSYKRSHDEKS